MPIQVVQNRAGLTLLLDRYRKEGKKIGLVPTMGSLHAGHASLVEASIAQGNITVCSVFVNPIQFNNLSDFDRYPKNIGYDIELLEKWGCDIVFAPPVEDVYPNGIQERLDYDPGKIATLWEGEHRPGHFMGMLTVVHKLFQMVGPCTAYFGAKDFQQQLLVKHMVEDLNLPVTIITSPTLRAPDGLALSSRNALLTPQERSLAPQLYKSLQRASNKVASSANPIEVAEEEIRSLTTLGFGVQYLNLCDINTLQTLEHWLKMDGKGGVWLLAASIGNVRLIDNLIQEVASTFQA